jgi:hypothetical protein
MRERFRTLLLHLLKPLLSNTLPGLLAFSVERTRGGGG